MFLIQVTDDDLFTKLHLMTKEQHAFCMKVLSEYREGNIDWPDDVNDILGSTEMKPGMAIPACELSTGSISTSGDGGGWYDA